MLTLRRIRHQASKSTLRVPLVWYRHRAIEGRDAFVASYPRSGSTWLRFLLCEILSRRPAEFENVNRDLPDVGGHVKAARLLPGGGRLVKTHERYRPEYSKAIYLVRDGRDVLLSEFAYEKALERFPGNFDDFLRLFLAGKVNGYGAWHHHVETWLDSPLNENGNLLLIRFEDMRQNTSRTLEHVLSFLGAEVNQNVIQQAIENNSVDAMRTKEERSPQLGKRPPQPRDDGRGRFIRSGSVRGWQGKLTDQQIHLIEQEAGDVLARMKYPIGAALAEKDQAGMKMAGRG